MSSINDLQNAVQMCNTIDHQNSITDIHYLISQVMLSSINDLQNAVQMCNTIDHQNSITDIFYHRPDQVSYFKTHFSFVEHMSVLL